MEGSVIIVITCVVALILSAVSCQGQECENMLITAGRRYNRVGKEARRRGEMLNIAHAHGRVAKCKFLDIVLSRSGMRTMCWERHLKETCPVTGQLPVEFASQNSSVLNMMIPTDCPNDELRCDPSSIYRSLNGSCNNLLHPRWGQANRQELRLLQNAFNDGRQEPRTRSVLGGALPSARRVSNMIHRTGPLIKFELFLSNLLPKFGQFLVHDLVLTEVFTRDDGSPLMCCTTDRNHPQCNPIRIPQDDTFFQPGSCMDFARSRASFDCFSIRQVLNSQTSFLDLSLVYGSSDEEAATLRFFNAGMLKNVQNKLPIDFSDSTCILSRPFDPIDNYCPLAGDGRVIEQPALASMHTIFMREHNRLAAGLARVNRHWDDERLYQEARKINIGQWQHIVYSEFLPAILGNDVVKRFNLDVPKYGYRDHYYPKVDATISNAFAVAVFRYGHSQVNEVLGSRNTSKIHLAQTEPLEQHFFEPTWYHARNGSGLEDILNWAASTRCPFTDNKVQNSIRQKLFLDDEGSSFDLISLNLHRGRDHGTPGYTAFRTFCRLSRVNHFGTGAGGLIDHDASIARLLRRTYRSPHDIDLFTGLVSEKRTTGSLLGPTWQCLLAGEFLRIRDGDRFFYERRDRFNPRIGFTENQLNAIKKVTMSHVMCLNTRIPFLQPNSLFRPNIWLGWIATNYLRPCYTYRSIDLSLWMERPYPNHFDRGWYPRK